MSYILKQFDRDLLSFDVIENTSELIVRITDVNDENRAFLPLNLQVSDESLSSWLKKRSIPQNRQYVHKFLSKCGLSINRPMNIIEVSKGLSLNDCYWVVQDGFKGDFDSYNLYDNRMSNILGWIAFTGYGSSVRDSLKSSPEFTTNGMLPKCWRRVDGKIRLFKGGTSGASNSGKEPFSEYYASRIAEILGVNAIEYNIHKWKGILCSSCELFTDKEFAFMPVGRMVKTGGEKAVREYIFGLGDEYKRAYEDMLVLDAIICNTDRHFGNFGFLINNYTNTISGFAPLFDHGNSLFNFAGDEDYESYETLTEYIDTLQPSVYDGFIETAKEVVSDRHKKGLRRLANLDISTIKHSRYNLPNVKLKLIERVVRERAKMLL